MTELVPIHDNDNAIPAKLDVAKRALEEATTDWERIDIRDYARAVAAATAILNRKDIQVQAANLVQDAERAIAKANPSTMSKSESGRLGGLATQQKFKQQTASSLLEKDEFSQENNENNSSSKKERDPLSSQNIRRMKSAHAHITDEEYETKKAEAVETGVPLTRTALQEEGRRKRIEKERREAQEKRINEDKAKESKTPTPNENSLNELTAKEWIKFSKSWFTLKPGITDREKTEVHPATFPAELATDYIDFFTKPGESVLDPFLGAGTTMEIAELMGRLSTGIELEPTFVEFASKRTSHPIIIGDSLVEIDDKEKFPDESFDYVFTSPPYWNTLHQSRGGNDDTRHKKRLERGEAIVYSDKAEDLGNISDADEYIEKLITLFTGVHRVLKPKRYLTIIIQNLNYEGSLVPIAWQLGIQLTETGLWDMKGERIWCKDQGRLGIYGYPTTYATNNVHHYCLTFRKV